jgi:hypothetical protein
MAPEFLPDGRHFLYTDYCDDRKRYGIYVGDLETGVTKRLLPVYSSAAYSTDGFLLYSLGALVAQPFSLDRLKTSGDAVPVADRAMQHYGLGRKVDFSVSRSGLLAARTATDEQTRLVWFDRTGHELGEVGDAALYSNPALSPSGRELVVTVGQGDGGPANLWLFDLGSGASSRLTFAKGANFAPVWSPAADRIIYASSRSRTMELYQRNLNGSGSDTKVLDAPMMQVPEAWSADGRHLTFSTMRPGTKSDVWVWQLDDDRPPVPVLQSPSNEGQSQVSPDGRFIAYISMINFDLTSAGSARMCSLRHAGHLQHGVAVGGCLDMRRCAQRHQVGRVAGRRHRLGEGRVTFGVGHQVRCAGRVRWRGDDEAVVPLFAHGARSPGVARL